MTKIPVLNKYLGEPLDDTTVLGSFTGPNTAVGDFVITGEKLGRLEEFPVLRAFLSDIEELVALEDSITPRYYHG